MNAAGEAIGTEEALEEAERGTSLWRDTWHPHPDYADRVHWPAFADPILRDAKS
jgi:hypothetical protein